MTYSPAPAPHHTHDLQFAAFWTINAVIVEVTYYTGGNVDVTPDEALALSAHDEWVLKYGSKWEFASWYTYSGCICMSRVLNCVGIIITF